jgi:hypothetical protein
MIRSTGRLSLVCSSKDDDDRCAMDSSVEMWSLVMRRGEQRTLKSSFLLFFVRYFTTVQITDDLSDCSVLSTKS